MKLVKGKCLGIMCWQQRWRSVVGKLDYALDGKRLKTSLTTR